MSQTTAQQFQLRNDSYMSLMSGLGTDRDPASNMILRASRLLNEAELNNIFQSDGIGRRVVESPAEEMIRPWFEIAGDEGGAVLDALEEIGAQQLVTEAIIWARLHGGTAVVLAYEDGRAFNSPLGQFRRLAGGRAFDRWRINRNPTSALLLPSYSERDPRRLLDGTPPRIGVSIEGRADQLIVHEDRFVLVPGARIPNQAKQLNDGWEAPFLQHCLEAVQRYAAGLGYSANILRDFIQAVLAVKDLTSMIAAGKDAVVERRLRLLDLSRSILNTMVIDADGEAYTKSASSVSGIDQIIDRFIEELALVTGIPVAKLAGRSAGGLNSTGDIDLQNYYDMLASERQRVAQPLVETLVRAVYRSSEGPTGGTEPERWSIQWNPFRQPTEVETAALRKTVAETDKIYLDSRVISPHEVAQSRWGQGEWSMETQLEPGEDGSRPTLEGLAEKELAAIEALSKAGEGQPGDDEGDPSGQDSREDATPRPLYVQRKVVNAAEIIRWATEQGMTGLLPASELHVTIAYSRAPVDWMAAGEAWEDRLELPAGGPRVIEQFSKGAIVLLFNSQSLKWRHETLLGLGASWDFPDYQPHITLSYEEQTLPEEGYPGKIVLGPELFEVLDPDFKPGGDA